MPTFFFFNDTATTEIYTLSLHDALPIYVAVFDAEIPVRHFPRARAPRLVLRDRKSTRLNSSHSQISYAVFCLKKKKNTLSARCYKDVHCRVCCRPVTITPSTT